MIYRREERALASLIESIKNIKTPNYNGELPLREEDFSQELVDMVVGALKEGAEGIAYFGPDKNGGFTKTCNQNRVLRIYVEDSNSLIYQNFKNTLNEAIFLHIDDILSGKASLEYQKDEGVIINILSPRFVS